MAQFDGIRFQPSRPLLKELSADRLNTILSEIKKNRVRGEHGITVRQTGDATMIGLAVTPKGGATAAAQPRLPWDIYIESTEGEGQGKSFTLKVQPGTLSRVLADNWDSAFAGINSTALYYGIARVSTDGSFITGVELVVTSAAPAEQAPVKFGLQSTINIVFGLFKGGTSYNIVQSANIDLDTVAVLAVNADPPALPGQSPYDIYYKLQ